MVVPLPPLVLAHMVDLVAGAASSFFVFAFVVVVVVWYCWLECVPEEPVAVVYVHSVLPRKLLRCGGV